MKDRADFVFVFENEDGESHVVDLEVLAPTLLEIATLLRVANRRLNGERYEAKISASASPVEGSLEIALVLDIGLVEQVKELISWQGLSRAADVLQLVGVLNAVGTVTTVSLIKLVKRFRGRRIEATRPGKDKATVIIRSGDQELEISQHVLDLYSDLQVRRSLARVAKAVERAGIEAISFKDSLSAREVVERISEEDVPSFAPPQDEGDILPAEVLLPMSTRVAALEVAKAWFREGRHKWQFSEGRGGATFNAEILDQGFLDRVHSGEIGFARGDVLIVEMSSETTRTADGQLRTALAILRVIEVRKRPVQESIGKSSDE